MFFKKPITAIFLIAANIPMAFLLGQNELSPKHEPYNLEEHVWLVYYGFFQCNIYPEDKYKGVVDNGVAMFGIGLSPSKSYEDIYIGFYKAELLPRDAAEHRANSFRLIQYSIYISLGFLYLLIVAVLIKFLFKKK